MHRIQKFLFVCAHPDDLEYFVGYFLASLGDINKEGTGYSWIFQTPPSAPIQIRILCITRGEMSIFTEKIRSTHRAAEIRSQEITTAMSHLGIRSLDFLGEIDGKFRITETLLQRVVNYLKWYQPDIIIAPEPVYPYYPHPDHLRSGRLMYYAIQRWKAATSTQIYPHLFFYGSLFNHFYFPKIIDFDSQVSAAIRAHQSQQALLTQGSQIDRIVSRIHGWHIRHSGFQRAEALRRQYLPIVDSPRLHWKLNRRFTWVRRILLVMIKRLLLQSDAHWVKIYCHRWQYYDGTLPPTLPF